MYRYSVDNALTYTPDDLDLFRESPFAAWMERLNLENPDHGIPPDIDSTEARDEPEPQDDIVATLRAEGRNVAHIDCTMDEASRRTATVDAMRDGVDFIVDGVLALGVFSGSANLLMRTSGYSELGDFLYVPCETRARNPAHSAFRLCFLADLLQSLQGQMPPQMLIIRDGADVQPLQTEEHIYYYQAVKKRFMAAMEQFRKHRMPDPAESAHFGRWSECASEVLKQRALRDPEPGEAAAEEVFEVPQLQVAGASGSAQVQFDSGSTGEQPGPVANNQSSPTAVESSAPAQEHSGTTLAEQARLLDPGSYRGGKAPGHTPNLARFGRPRPVAVVDDRRSPEHNRRSSDEALQNLEFIGSNVEPAPDGALASTENDAVSILAPPPSLRESPVQIDQPADELSKPIASVLPELEPRDPVFLPPDELSGEIVPPAGLPPKPLDSDKEGSVDSDSMMDMDSAPAPALAPVVQRAEVEFERMGLRDPMFRSPHDSAANTEEEKPEVKAERKPELKPEPKPELAPTASPFSDSLITSEEFDDS